MRSVLEYSCLIPEHIVFKKEYFMYHFYFLNFRLIALYQNQLALKGVIYILNLLF